MWLIIRALVARCSIRISVITHINNVIATKEAPDSAMASSGAKPPSLMPLTIAPTLRPHYLWSWLSFLCRFSASFTAHTANPMSIKAAHRMTGISGRCFVNSGWLLAHS